MKPDTFSLSRDVSSLLQTLLQQGKVRCLEECLGRTNGVRRIGNDDVVFVFVLGKELEAIANVDGDSRVLVACRHVGEEFLRDSDHSLTR